MKLFIPSSVKKLSKKQEKTDWINDICRKALKDKEDAFSVYKTIGTNTARDQFKTARNKCKSIIKRQRFLYNQKLKRKTLEQPANNRSFWSFAKKVKNNFCDSTFPPLISDNSATLVTNSQEKANIFARMFASNSTISPSTQSPPPIPELTCSIPKIYFRSRTVFKILSTLDSKKSTGPDGLPAEVLKNTAAAICKPLRNLF